jgi:very-short-patch-repair endonuclease
MASGIKYTNEEFINKSNKIHNNKFNYELVKYINAHTKIKLICSVHGIFEQLPYQHLNGHGCKKCADKENGKNKRKGKNKFIEESKKIHHNKYDYSLINYMNAHTKIKIICKEHGIFEQTPSAHTNNKQGCPICANNIKLTIEQFIEKSIISHNNKYNYSLANYIDNRTKIKIICPIHGEFEQRPTDHMRGIGCQICQDSKGEKTIKEFLNNKNIEYINQKKFDGCKYKRNLKFDFYLPKYNIVIEYDGQQHYTTYRFEKNTDKLKIRQLRDEIKTEYCKNNNIQLIRIKYNEDIIERLKSYL